SFIECYSFLPQLLNSRDQDHTTQHRYAKKRNETHCSRDTEVGTCGQQREHSSNQGQGDGPQQQKSVAEVPKSTIEEEENDQQAYRHDNLQASDRCLQLLEFASPLVTIALGNADLLAKLLLSLCDGALEVTTAHAEFNGDITGIILAIDEGGASLLNY